MKSMLISAGALIPTQRWLRESNLTLIRAIPCNVAGTESYKLLYI